MSTPTYETIIVGGGPIGSILATLLARQGIAVAIIEKQKHPRWKPCGEGLSTEGIELLKTHHLCRPLHHLFSNITDIGFNILEKNIATHVSNTPIAVTFDRAQFDHLLLKHAQDAGVDVYESETVKDIDFKKRTQVRTARDNYTANIVIGADGAYSVVGKRIYRPWKENEIGLAEVARYALSATPKTVDSMVMEYYFINGGMGWIFPRKKDGQIILNVGVVPKENNKIREIFTNFIKLIESAKIIKLMGREIDCKIWRHPIPCQGPCRGTHTPSTLLIGDAGGFVHPLTGGGLKYGTLSAIYATETIKNLLNNESDSLEPYEQKWQSTITPIFDKALDLRKKLYFMTPSQLLEKIKKYPELRDLLIQSFI